MQLLRTHVPHEPRFGRAVFHEVVLALSGFVIYFLVRGLTEGRVDDAIANANDLMRLEGHIGLAREVWLQEMLLRTEASITLMNWMYIFGHWPVILVVAVWLVLTQPAHYRILRNAFLVSGAIGLVIFIFYPVAPPRLIDIGLIDTVSERSRAYRVLQPPAFVNQYAAMPSLHFGWDLLVGIALFVYGQRLVLRIIGVTLPGMMAAAVVLTGNHYIIDVVAGGALALFGLAVALTYARRDDLRRRRDGIAELSGAS